GWRRGLPGRHPAPLHRLPAAGRRRAGHGSPGRRRAAADRRTGQRRHRGLHAGRDRADRHAAGQRPGRPVHGGADAAPAAAASGPNLAVHGGSTAVGGDPGGYYTKADYQQIVAYAAQRYITIVPEIDMPGHTNAALSSYAELNCDGVAPPLYTGTDVGFSSLCVNKEVTYRFLDDVLRELAALTPGKYLHIGTDEAHATTPADYLTFINRVIPIVTKYGKSVTGWHQFAKANPPVSAVPQFWDTDNEDADVAAAAARGNQIV